MTYATYQAVEEVLFSQLATLPELTAHIGTEHPRLFAHFAPQALAELPYVVFYVTTQAPIYRTPTPELEVVYRVIVYADTRALAHELQGIIHHTLMNSPFSLTGYGCYAVHWLGANITLTTEGAQAVWAVMGDYRVRWVMA